MHLSDMGGNMRQQKQQKGSRSSKIRQQRQQKRNRISDEAAESALYWQGKSNQMQRKPSEKRPKGGSESSIKGQKSRNICCINERKGQHGSRISLISQNEGQNDSIISLILQIAAKCKENQATCKENQAKSCQKEGRTAA